MNLSWRSKSAISEKGSEMKNLNKILFIAAFTAISSLTARVSALNQGTAEDGITASPKLREQLNERNQVNQVTSRPPSAVITTELSQRVRHHLYHWRASVLWNGSSEMMEICFSRHFETPGKQQAVCGMPA